MAELKDLFKSFAAIQILDFLTLYDGYEYTKSEIIENTGISRRTLYEDGKSKYKEASQVL